MKELIYTILELEEWCSNGARCSFCTTLFSDEDIAVCQIRTRSKTTNKMVANNFACQKCKEKFENNELSKCEKCGRLKNKSDADVITGEYICRCIKHEEELEGKELPVLPCQRGEAIFYEEQISSLRKNLTTAETEIDTHLEALEISEDWHKRQKQELLDRIKELEAENKKLKELTPQELVNELNSCKEKIKSLEEQNNQLTAQIEVKETKK